MSGRPPERSFWELLRRNLTISIFVLLPFVFLAAAHQYNDWQQHRPIEAYWAPH